MAQRASEPDTDTARAERYAARTAMTSALSSVRLSGAPARLSELAVALVAASVAVGDAPSLDHGAVQEAGDSARAAHQALETAAASHLR
ncbi:hypothetical protein J8N05_47120 (plasmid) [Streptomyces sp. BH-SS-21]|uniref:Uncharacterized protein n=1 Tax=Streptomyces liliiviolaceus TaxID=2823109 RepID=A0A941BJ91_9ACTN|nr:hypothetical protein [Streptomyces liliiviolaceus]MBQ0855734.1 hypothetical protein [Streptomyces liliiviolaceus]